MITPSPTASMRTSFSVGTGSSKSYRNTARAATNTRAVWLRTAKHSTVTAAATSVVVSHAWPSSIEVTNRPSFCPNASPTSSV